MKLTVLTEYQVNSKNNFTQGVVRYVSDYYKPIGEMTNRGYWCGWVNVDLSQVSIVHRRGQANSTKTRDTYQIWKIINQVEFWYKNIKCDTLLVLVQQTDK